MSQDGQAHNYWLAGTHEPKPQRTFCPKCYDLPHRREQPACPECAKPYEAQPELDSRMFLGKPESTSGTTFAPLTDVQWSDYQVLRPVPKPKQQAPQGAPAKTRVWRRHRT